MAHRMQTQDGWTITTVEQHGRYCGYEIGRVWLKGPVPHTDTWVIYEFASAPLARRASEIAQGMTKKQFDVWYEQDIDPEETPA